jgi:small subunit ribosomal protein S13
MNTKIHQIKYDLIKLSGIKHLVADKIFASLGFHKNTTSNMLIEENFETFKLFMVNFIKKQKLSKLKKTIKQFIDKKKNLKIYQGIRHIHKLSVRGQRTKTNCQTQKKLGIIKKSKKLKKMKNKN